jgi:hypothetical protein
MTAGGGVEVVGVVEVEVVGGGGAVVVVVVGGGEVVLVLVDASRGAASSRALRSSWAAGWVLGPATVSSPQPASGAPSTVMMAAVARHERSEGKRVSCRVNAVPTLDRVAIVLRNPTIRFRRKQGLNQAECSPFGRSVRDRQPFCNTLRQEPPQVWAWSGRLVATAWLHWSGMTELSEGDSRR